MAGHPDTVSGVDADTLRNKPGRARRELYLLIGRQVGGLDRVQRLLAEHLAYLHRLHGEGCLMLAGPTLIDRGARYDGDGCLLIAAGDLADAERVAAADPYQSGGARAYQVVPWLTSEGVLYDMLGDMRP